MKFRRKRTLLMVLLLLVGGAVINVAVTWGFAMWGKPVNYPAVKDYVMLSEFEAEHFLKGRFPDIATVDRAQFGGMRTEAIGRTVTEYGLRPDGIRYIIKKEFGIPWRSMSLEYADSWTTLKPYWCLPAPKWLPWTKSRHELPLRPVWPGFAINTIFYAAILWLLFAVPGFIRRRIRIRRGQCPACGYPIGTNPVCTECGTAVEIRG